MSYVSLPPRALQVPEIADLVFSELKDDRRDLKSCSLVCRSLGTDTAHHIFATIRLNPSLFIPVAGHEEERVKWFALLTARVTTSVHEVILDRRNGRPESLPLLMQLPVRITHIIASTFPNLRSISCISSLEFVEDLPSAQQSQISLNRPCLDNLRISVWNTSFRSTQLAELLSLVREVGQLTLDYNDFDPLPSPPAYEPGSSATRAIVRSLVLGSFNETTNTVLFPLLTMAANAIDPASLTSLSIVNYEPDGNIAPINTFLQQSTFNLTNFRFTLHQDVSYVLIPPSNPTSPLRRNCVQGLEFALRHCKVLRSISVGLLIRCGRAASAPCRIQAFNEYVWAPCINVVSNACHGSLTRVRLDMSVGFELKEDPHTVDFCLPLRKLDWPLLGRALENHPQLHTLDICFPDDFELFDEAQRAVEGSLPESVRPHTKFSRSVHAKTDRF